ncbi:MAG: glycogen debranching protein GlgX [Desulfopila sp.]|jgi:glycogen operon protein|nr:glycogen debranching protein GlgX [Desulfopila sp.]
MSKNIGPAKGKRGFPLPLGATVLPGGINFAIFSRHAHSVELVVEAFASETETESYSFTLLPEYNKTGDIWHILLPLYWKNIRYGYRINGTTEVRERGTFFDDSLLLLDPYCRKLEPRKWGEEAYYGQKPCCRIPEHSFDWQEDTPLKTPLNETIIYELHVRGFTASTTSGVKYPGTYRGIIEKIPYLQSLGVTAVELMPIAEFDENDNPFLHPDSGERLKNLWGYNSINFFSLKSGYAANPTDHIREFKEMVLALHRAGIEVILDIVFNHSGEGGYNGTTTSFRGIDNPVYYLLEPDSHEYMNFSGCGNTMNCNHPVVREFIRGVLRYWVIEMHVDGFRFDLASILGRDTKGNVLPDPPMLELIAEDPILRDTKIIAEAWDAAGLYQVGSFSTDKRWSEWNGKFRDDVRSFFAGFPDSVTNLATRIAGSSDLYLPSSRGPCNSINFITSHDGFTLYDLVSFEKKNNRLNGENNRDGDNHNISWNSGKEGLQISEKIEAFRLRRIKSMALTLLLSQGVPMLTAGDEFGRTQQGNNNAWCQDNETSWLDWSKAAANSGLLRFFRKCIELRKKHHVFRREFFFKNAAAPEPEEIIWQSLSPGTTDWSPICHHLGFLLNGSAFHDNHFFVMLNGSRTLPAAFELPQPPEISNSSKWYKIIDTAQKSPKDFVALQHASFFRAGDIVQIAPMGAVVLQTR